MSTSHTFRLFISSTFSDFQEERTLLQTKVFPEIKEYAATKGYIFQPVDLRWGVSNEAQLDQKILELCLSEVRACKTYPHPNFLVMLGDRYGWVPIPYAIEQEEFETLLGFAEDKELLNEWYKLDTNQIPASYIIKERSGEYEDFFRWSEVESKLRSLLQSAVEKTELSQEQKRKYFLSATEAEVEEGIIPYLNHTLFQKEELLQKDASLDVVDPQHIFGFFRDVDKLTQIGNFFISDDYKKAQLFKEKVAATLPSNNRLQIRTKQIDTEHLDTSYLEEFQTRVTEFLKEQIDKQRVEEKRLSPLEVELESQAYYAMNKRAGFLGQESLKEEIHNYIDGDMQQAFVLYGKSGSGKSAVMAKLIEETEDQLQKRVLYRFVGATPSSSTSQEILISLFEELGKDVKGNEEENFEVFSKRIYSEIQNIKDEVAIFIDAVDQLQNDDSFLWLPYQLPSNVKIVLSALDDENYKEDSKFFQKLRNRTKNIYQIPPFNEPTGLLKTLLVSESRTLNTKQEAYFLEQYSKVKRPLYVRVAAEEIKHYRSGDATQRLADTQRGIIEEFIENLTTFKHHNREFVTRVLGYIYASRDGLSESELLQLLSQDETFVQKMAPETWHANPNKELPLSHWSRLHSELKAFLSLKKVDNEELFYFFHREFEDVVANKAEQEQEHSSIIKATQRLILKNQDKAFDANRWGKLYIILITEYELRYKDKAKHKEFSLFLADTKQLQEEWIDKCLFELIGISLNHNSYNRMYKAIAYQETSMYASKILCIENSVRWVEFYISDLNNLANSYKKQNRLDRAIALEEESLAIGEKFYKENPTRWAELYTGALNNLSISYSMQNRLKEAIALGEHSLAIQEELCRENPVRWAGYYIGALNNLAVSYRNQNRLDKAIALEEHSLVILEEFYRENPVRWAEDYTRALNNLASFCKKQNRMKEAIELGEHSLKIREELYRENPARWAEDYTIALNNLASSYYNQNRLDKAIELGEQSLAILEELYRENPARWAEDYTRALSDLALFYENQNHLDKAIELGEQSLAIQEKFYRESPACWTELYTGTLINLIYFYQKQNCLDKAIELGKHSLSILEELYRENPARWAELYTRALNNLAVSYYKNGASKEALELLFKSYEVHKQIYGDSDSRTLQVVQNIQIVSGNEKNTSKETATLQELLFLSKFIALVNEKEKISIASFVNAFGFIEFNEGAKSLFSQVVDFDTIKTYENASQYIQKVKELPQIQFDEDLKELVSRLKEIFGDDAIGTLR